MHSNSVFRAAILILVTVLVLVASSRSVRPTSPGPAAAFTLNNIATAAKVNFRQINFATEMKYPFETLGGAVAALDYNNDGFVDLFFLNGAPSPEHVRTDPACFNRLYKNNGDGTFSHVTEAAGLTGKGIRGYPQGTTSVQHAVADRRFKWGAKPQFSRAAWNHSVCPANAITGLVVPRRAKKLSTSPQRSVQF